MAARPASSPLSRFAIFLLLGGFAVVLALLWVANQISKSGPVAERGGAALSGSAPAALPERSRPASPPAADAAAQLEELMARTLAALNDPAIKDKKPPIEALRDALTHAEPAAAIAAIRHFLKGGQNASTGLRFKVGEGGTLTAAPSLRTFLMDELGTLSDGAGTQDAAEAARDVLETKGSADEWAVALRNLAWADPDGSKPLLAAKVRELINYQPWQSAPTGGYLEAFDVASYSGDASLIADLAPLSRASGSPVQQAALVALERLSALAPAAVATYLNDNPGVLSDEPMLRADYMGNMDLSDPAQVTAAQTYLQRTDVSEAEKEKFLARLGVPAGFISDNLLTPADAAAMPLAEHRAIVNQTASTWLASGRFPALQPSLETLIQNTQPKP